MRVRMSFSGGKLRSNLEKMPPRLENLITAHVMYASSAGEARMKTNARWTDRTGAARSGLHTTWGRSLRMWEIIFAHAVHYGIWLEVRRDFHGRYAIVMDSVVSSGDDLMSSLRGIFREI